MSVNVHDGHRERIRRRYKDHGLDNFGEITALEFLLFFCIPRQDTNELAHRLIERFDSLSGVLGASMHELMEVPGVGESTAMLITLVPQLYKLANVESAKKAPRIKNSRDAVKYLAPRYMLETDEVLYLLCLDSKKQVIACAEISRGVANSVQTSNRRIVELALKYRATSVILAHNHPESVAEPSREDDVATRQIYSALELVGIPLVDHIIVSGDNFISYADAGVIRMYTGERERF